MEVNSTMPNVMPSAMVEPITDMEMIVAKLKHEGELNKRSTGNTTFNNQNKEV